MLPVVLVCSHGTVEGTVGKHLVCFDIFKLAQLFFVIAGHHVW